MRSNWVFVFRFLLLALITFSYPAKAQDEVILSLLKTQNAKKRIDTLEAYARSQVFVSAEEGLKASLYLTREGMNQNDKKRILNSYNFRGLAFHYLQKGPEAEKVLDTLIQLALKNKDTLMEGKGRGNLGMVLEKRGDFQNAFAQYLFAFKLAELSQNNAALASSCGNLGNVLIRMQGYEKAIPYLRRSARLFAALGNINAEANQYNSLAQAYEDLEENDSSYFYLLKAEGIFRKLNNKNALGTVLTNLANYHEKNKNITTSILLGEEALQIKLEMEDYLGAAVALLNLSESYNKNGKFDEAIKLIERADTLIEDNDHFMRGEVFRKRASLYRAKGDYKTAYANILEYLDVKDSIIGEKAQQAVAEFREKFEAEKKEFEIEKLTRSAEIDTLKISKHQTQLYFMFGGLACVLIFAGFMYNRFKVTQKQKSIIEAQKILVEEQKHLVEEKQKEMLDSIHYARRIQMAQIPSEKHVSQTIKRLKNITT